MEQCRKMGGCKHMYITGTLKYAFIQVLYVVHMRELRFIL